MNEEGSACKSGIEAFRLAGYNHGKVHQKQMLFHKSSARNRWIFGGNRTGKTECGAVEAVWFARGIHPFRKIEHATCGWVVSLTGEVQRMWRRRRCCPICRRSGSFGGDEKGEQGQSAGRGY